MKYWVLWVEDGEERRSPQPLSMNAVKVLVRYLDTNGINSQVMECEEDYNDADVLAPPEPVGIGR